MIKVLSKHLYGASAKDGMVPQQKTGGHLPPLPCAFIYYQKSPLFAGFFVGAELSLSFGRRGLVHVVVLLLIRLDIFFHILHGYARQRARR